MDRRLGEEPATRWDRLVAVLEEVQPECVIDASHIIERERKNNMTDLELFYVLSLRFQAKESKVLDEVLNLYVLLSTWMDWLVSCDECLSRRRGGRNSRRKGGAPQADETVSPVSHNRLRPVPSGNMLSSPANDDLCSDSVTTYGSTAMHSVSVATPLTRNNTYIHSSVAGTSLHSTTVLASAERSVMSNLMTATDVLATLGSSADTAGIVKGTIVRPPPALEDSVGPAASQSNSASAAAAETFLSKLDLPPNWASEGSLNFLRDGRVLRALVEEAVDQCIKSPGKAGPRLSGPRTPESDYDRRFPSLADVEKQAGGGSGCGGGGAGSNGGGQGGGGNNNACAYSTLAELHHLTVSQSKPRGRRSRTSRALRMMEIQGKTTAEARRTVETLNHLCERYLGWDQASHGGRRFFDLPSADRLLRPTNNDDAWLLRRLHWMAVALYTTINNEAIIPAPPRVSFLISGRAPGGGGGDVDRAEENSELAVLIATKFSCLPHNHKLQLIVEGGNVVLVSHPTAHPQALRFPCCVVDGEAFVFSETSGLFFPLWRLLKIALKEWDDITWNFELPFLERKADHVLISASQLRQKEMQQQTAHVAGAALEAPTAASSASVVRSTVARTPLLPGTNSSAFETRAQSVSAAPPSTTMFDLTIKSSNIRCTRGLTTSNTSMVSPTPAVEGSFAAPTSRAMTSQQGTGNRSFGDEPEGMVNASFPGISAVRVGRSTRVSTTSATVPVGDASGPAHVSMRPLEDTAAAMSPEREGPQHIPVSRAVRAGRAAPSAVRPKAGSAIAVESECLAVAQSHSNNTPTVIPSTGEDSQSPSRTERNTGFVQCVSAGSYGEHAEAESGQDEPAGAGDVTQEGWDGGAPVASATLSAVTSRGIAVGQDSPTHPVLGVSFHEESMTPVFDDYEGTSQSYFPSDIARVKNFSATVVHESAAKGIDVRDHHFRVSGRPIGKGAFGAVYRALDLETGVIVAVKQSRYSMDSGEHGSLNWREFQTWSMLPAHPNVITFHGASKEVETHQLLLVLEFASGGSIVAMYQNYRPIPEHLFLLHAKGIALGLKHLHDHNVIHGDVKPENVLTRSDGSVAISDFGCSRLTLPDPGEDSQCGSRGGSSLRKESSGQREGQWHLFGTAAFMAPEVITNEPDFKSDVWAYACTLAHLWLGHPPWSGVPDTREITDSIPLMFFIATHEGTTPYTAEELAGTPRWLQRIAHRSYERDLDRRANMTEIISILAEYC